MSSVIAPKTVVLTARAAQDLRDAALIGRNTPYLEITLGAEKVVTQHATASMNPVFDETFTFQLPGEQPDAPPPTLRVTAMNAARLLPDQTIGTGTVQLGKLYIEGSEEARVPLHDSTGKPAGVAYIGVRLVTPEEEMEIPSAAGTVLGEKLRGPQGEVGPIGPAIVPTTEVGPATPAVGAVAPGNLDDPAGPAYGILKD